MNPAYLLPAMPRSRRDQEILNPPELFCVRWTWYKVYSDLIGDPTSQIATKVKKARAAAACVGNVKTAKTYRHSGEAERINLEME
jgi:hypothetical protein